MIPRGFFLEKYRVHDALFLALLLVVLGILVLLRVGLHISFDYDQGDWVA